MFNVYDQIYKNYEQEYLQNEGKYTSDDFKKLHKIFAKVYIRYAKSLNRILVNHHKKDYTLLLPHSHKIWLHIHF